MYLNVVIGRQFCGKSKVSLKERVKEYEKVVLMVRCDGMFIN